jgi:hypothetical protein
MSIKVMESLGLVSDRPTYSKYKELLQAQRAKTSRLFNGWTKAGRCELVAKEILERLVVYWGIDMADKDLLIEVLNTEVLPKVDKKCRAQITQQLDRVLPGINKRCREKILDQKHSDLQKIFGFGVWGPAEILGKVDGEERNNLIDQLHTLFAEKLKGCQEIGRCRYALEKIPKNEILGFVSLLNRINIPVDNAHEHIERLQQMVARVPDGMRVISELLNVVPAKATALVEILALSGAQASNLMEIIKNVPTKEQKGTLIDRLHILFVDKLKERTYIIPSCIEDFNGIPGNEIADFVTLLNCVDVPDYGFNSVLRDLKEIVKEKPDAIRPITDLLRIAPAKVDALIKILKLPDGTNAVPNFLDILKKIPTREQKEVLIDQIHTLFVEHYHVRVELPSLCDYLSNFQGFPENERLDFIFLLNDLVLSDKSYKSEKFDNYIQFFKNCPVEERRVIANQAKRLLVNLGPDGSNYTPYAALNLVLAIPTEEMRNAFIDQIPTFLGDIQSFYGVKASVLLYLFLFPNEGDRINQARNLNYLIQDLPIQKQIALLFQAQHLYAGLSPLVGNPLDTVVLLKEKIPENEREIFIGQIPSLIEEVNHLNGLANNVKLQVLLFIFQRMAPVERSDFIQHLCNLRVPSIQDHLENLLALPVNERADRVEAINLQYELENAQAALINRPLGTLIVDPADFSDEARNPTRPLLQLFAEISQKQRFPRIRYQNSEGSDAGGLTRDFVSQIFQALCHPDQKSLPLMASDNRYFPKVEVAPPPALPLEDQIKCYQAIGMLFARAINGDPSLAKGKDSVTTGTHFHPNMFAMIHALTLDEMNLIPDPLAHDSVPDVKLKLTKLYLKAQFPQLFRPHGIEEAIVDDEIVKLMNGEVSQRLQESGVDEDFLKDYHVNSIIQATLIIAKSMHKNLAISDQWAGIIGNSPESLSKRIEGSLTPDLVIDAFGLKDEAEDTRKGMVKRWVRTASPEALKNFVFSLTGSTSLSPGQKLSVQLCEVLNNPENAPVFHTCGQYMDLPRYETYEIFETKLGISIASAMAGGFQVA